MAETSLNKNLSLTGGTVKISVQHNKKFQCAVVFVKFTTSQSNLLTMLLQKYTLEKVLTTGVNMNNSIYSAIPGHNSIVLQVPENKITNNISLLLSYLAKTHLTTQQAKQVGKGDYAALARDIKSFEVIITGKCKTFLASLKSNATKITNMVNTLNAISPKDRASFNNGDSAFVSIPFEGKSKNAKLYASILLEDIPAIIDNDEITLLTSNGRSRLAEKLKFKDALQGKVKSFLTQTGAVGTPAANDKGGAKFAEKTRYILACENSLAEIYSNLRGFNYTFSSVDDLKKVDSEAMANVKALKVF